MSGATMQIALYHVDIGERTLLAGLTSAQLARLQVEPGRAAALEAYLRQVGYLAAWECRQTSATHVKLIQPVMLNAGTVVAVTAAPCPQLPLVA